MMLSFLMSLVGGGFGMSNLFMLAYRPFFDPIDVHSWWLVLAVPLVFFISMSYKAMRVPTMRFYWRQVIKMSLQILVALVVLAFALFLLVEVALPYM